jgi:MFS family permease
MTTAESTAQTPPAAEPAPMTSTQRFTLLALGLGLFMIFLDALIVNVALPAIQADFGVGEAGMQWVVTAYSLGMAVAIMSAATAADLYGRRRVYLVSTVVFTVASAACGIAPTLPLLNTARIIQGVAAAAINVASLALVSSAFPDPKQKVRAIGIWTAIASTAIAVGPTLGGVLVQAGGWRSIFLVNVPVVAIVFLTLRFVSESRDERERRFDSRAAARGGGGRLRLRHNRRPHADWLSVEILTLAVAGGAGGLRPLRVAGAAIR